MSTVPPIKQNASGARHAPAPFARHAIDAGSLDGHRWLLHFEPELEAQFLLDRAAHHLLLSRVNLWLACVLYAAFICFDTLILRHPDSWLHQVVYFVLLPPCVLGAIATHVPRLQRYTLTINAWVALLTGPTLAILVAEGSSPGAEVGYQALILHYIYLFALFGLPYWQAAAIAGLSYLICVVGESLAGADPTLRFYHAFFLGSIVAVCVIVAYLQETTQRGAWLQTRKLKYLSSHDPLTGLLNHREFFERSELLLRQARRQGESIAFLFVDVDNFKAFNDQHGHAVGDELLRCCGSAISALVSRPLDMAARLGGDEFILVLYGASQDGARGLADQLRRSVSAMHFGAAGVPQSQATVSIGIQVTPPGASTTLHELIGQADAEMYRAKAGGRSGWHLIAGNRKTAQDADKPG